MNHNQVKVIVTLQYYENYSESGYHWKPKGSQLLSFVVDSDYWMYMDDRIKSVVNTHVGKMCNGHVKFEVISYDVLMEEPEDITKVIHDNLFPKVDDISDYSRVTCEELREH